MKKYGDLEIPEQNIIKFEKNKESLEEFVRNFVTGSIKIKQNLEEALE